jgi:hypothetical protein
MRRPRTIARLALSLLFLGALAVTLAPTASAKVPRLVFPVVGTVSYTDDFGDPRWQGSHEGNDLMAAWKAPVVAVEAGKVRIYTRSSSAGCMLYLYGKSGTTYLFIHLNNDRTAKNDNKGGCKRGVAYAPGLKDGQSVRTGQLIGYVGDSGDADGVGHHLHFELHPDGGRAVSPYKHLRKAERLLFAVPEGPTARGTAGPAALTLTATVVAYEQATAPEEPRQGGAGSEAPPPPPARAASAGSLTVKVGAVRVGEGAAVRLTRRVVLSVAPDAALAKANGKRARWADLKAGTKVTVTTAPVEPSLATQRARPGVLVAAQIRVR